MSKTFVGWMDTNCCIAQNCLWTSCCNSDKLILSLDLVFQVVKLTLHFFVYHLFVGKGSFCRRIPVYHSYSPIYQSFLKQVNKNFNYRFAAGFVHGKGSAVPVAGGAQFF